MDSVRRIAEDTRAGSRLPSTSIDEALQRIAKVEPLVEAWVEIDAAGAREAAAWLEVQGNAIARLPLAGVPVGVKDIIDVAGLPTRNGAGPFAHRQPYQDAAVVAALRAAGALVLGKTATTEFAFLDPAPTRNPWNRDHTPGGSSSGSAAAVAAGMVPAAIGTQTVGSVLRPAAFCGVVGLKPSFAWCPTDGVSPLAWSFDHIGVFAGSVADAALVVRAIAGREEELPPSRPGRLGVPRAFFTERSTAEVLSAVEGTAQLLEDAGGVIHDVEIPPVAAWMAPGRRVMAAEAAAAHGARYGVDLQGYGAQIAALIREGRELGAVAYVEARQALADLRGRLLSVLGGVDALLLPVAPTTAPAGLGSTGDASFCAPASFTGCPAIAVPVGVGAGGLPLAVQLVGRPGHDDDLVALAGWVEAVAGGPLTPPLGG